MNPGHPLLAAAEPTTHSHPEGREHASERAAARGEDDADTYAHDANTESFGRKRLALPLRADPGEEPASRLR